MVKSPENTFFMTSSHSKVSALFSMVLQLNVQNGKGGRKVMWIKSSRDFFFFNSCSMYIYFDSFCME